MWPFHVLEFGKVVLTNPQRKKSVEQTKRDLEIARLTKHPENRSREWRVTSLRGVGAERRRDTKWKGSWSRETTGLSLARRRHSVCGK
jgi:hypothetical protein